VFESSLLWWATLNKNVDWINYIYKALLNNYVQLPLCHGKIDLWIHCWQKKEGYVKGLEFVVAPLFLTILTQMAASPRPQITLCRAGRKLREFLLSTTPSENEDA